MSATIDPILIDVPERIVTERLVLRMPRCGDGVAVHAAVAASHAELVPWLPWASALPSVDESEIHCRRQLARFILREDFVMLMFERIDSGSEGAGLGADLEGAFVGALGLHRIDWALRRFEIGYWRRTGCEGRGYVTEAVRAISRMAFDSLRARRVEVRMDDANVRSWMVAERAGFTLEALLRFDSATPLGEPRSTRIYARVSGAEEPLRSG